VCMINTCTVQYVRVGGTFPIHCVPKPYFPLVGLVCRVGVVMETHTIPPGKSSSQVRVFEQLK
jgi:hypothetical protein